MTLNASEAMNRNQIVSVIKNASPDLRRIAVQRRKK